MQTQADEFDYYMEEGRLVFTSEFLLQRGYCCGSGCRHCPYNIITSSDGGKEKNKKETGSGNQTENSKAFRQP
jgi:hypothetical protein